MKRLAAIALLLRLLNQPLRGAEENQPATRPIAPLQQQIDELKTGQERILKEIEEIHRLLGERPGRIEYDAKAIPPKVISLNVHGEPFKGESQARVAIMEYSDFDCSFCAKYVSEIFPRIDQEYIRSGKIKYFFRDLPAPGETNALLKARVARCAGEQGKFWEMHDRLFSIQSAPPPDQDPTALAKSLELDLGKFNVCLNSERYVEAIKRSSTGAARLGIAGTPAFLIGTVSEDGDFFRAAKLQLGGEKLEDFKSALDELLTAPTGN